MASVSKARIRIYWHHRGAHIHCRVFTTGKVGNLIFSEREWPAMKRQFEKIATITQDAMPELDQRQPGDNEA